MDTEFRICLQLVIKPIYGEDPPRVNIKVGPCSRHDYVLDREQIFNFDYFACKKSNITVDFLNKNPQDTDLDRGLDKVVVVESVSFFGINDPRFVWAGIYRPNYPESWLDRDSAQWPDSLPAHNYLSWNGTWKLEFDVPVFGWIHRVQGQGWIFD